MLIYSIYSRFVLKHVFKYLFLFIILPLVTVVLEYMQLSPENHTINFTKRFCKTLLFLGLPHSVYSHGYHSHEIITDPFSFS